MNLNRNKIELFISVIIINEKSKEFINKIKGLNSYLNDNYSDYEIIIINNKSEMSQNIKRKKQLLDTIPYLRLLNLSSNFSNEVCYSIGAENAIGDVLILFDIFNDPIEIIRRSTNKIEEGKDLIVGVLNKKNKRNRIVRKFLSIVNYNLPPHSTEYRCYTRELHNLLNKLGNKHNSLFIQLSNFSQNSTILLYPFLSQNIKHKTFFEKFSSFYKIIIYNSTFPLRFINSVGFIGSLMAFVFASYSILVGFIKKNVVEGWTSIVFFFSILFMIVFIILAFIGEYFVRLFGELSNQSEYFITSEERSRVFFDKTKYNITNKS